MDAIFLEQIVGGYDIVDSGNEPVRKYRENQGEVEVGHKGKKSRTGGESVQGKSRSGSRGIDVAGEGCDIHCKREKVRKGAMVLCLLSCKVL